MGILSEGVNYRDQMPVLFIGHGSPMNAIEENQFTEGWKEIADTISKPRAILCISAHWETMGTYVTAMEKPRTIHDFGGFPRTLYDVRYPAPGSPGLAVNAKEMISRSEVGLDLTWGLDHGTWSVLKHFYPDADVPVIQMSLDYQKSPRAHYDLARELSGLRKQGIIIIGSGNMVHNLAMVAWDRVDEPDFGFDWAVEANDKMKRFILAGDHESLIDYKSQGSDFNLAIPTPEHYLPLLYILALKEKAEGITFFNDAAVMGSLSMTSLKISSEQ